MLNYANLSDVEFEYLCQDIMQEKLGVKLHRFARGRDDGIDLTDDTALKKIIVQVKHYVESSVAQLIATLKNEAEKLKVLSPNEYYICFSKMLSPNKVNEIYCLFSTYMSSAANVITLSEIDDFLHDRKNVEILKKHYKLWLDSTGILEDVANNGLFVDCETLLADIHREKALFVKTTAFEVALNYLENNKTIFITGNPGVGKTITSKMLVLHYVTMDYRARFSTDISDLSALKKSLSQNPERKEVILVDDCLGQAYFNMKESQSSELASLINYVNMSSNKRLILNSRITILQEAKGFCPRLVTSLEGKCCKTYILDMSNLDILDKAKILYNHIFFMGMDKEYFAEISKEKRYYNVITHPNYTPRMIEFICNPSRYRDIKALDYYSFIMQQLANPKEIWKDEYEHRLGKVDRLLLLTIYSLSDSMVEEEDVKKCFERLMLYETDIDMTINQYEASLSRLLDGFIQIVIKKGKKKLRMANPSINDYIDGWLNANALERNRLIRNVVSIQQKMRLLRDDEFEAFVDIILRNHKVGEYLFTSGLQQDVFVIYYLSKNSILDKLYVPQVQTFLRAPQSLSVCDKELVRKIEIFRKILQKDFCKFYEISDFLIKESVLEQIFESCTFEELLELIALLDKFYKDDARDEFIVISLEQLKYAIESYSGGFDVYSLNVDVEAIISASCCLSDRYGEEEINIKRAVEILEDHVLDAISADVEEKCSLLPFDIKKKLAWGEYVDCPDFDPEDMILSCLNRPYGADDDYTECNPTEDVNTEIDLMFNRNGLEMSKSVEDDDSFAKIVKNLLC